MGCRVEVFKVLGFRVTILLVPLRPENSHLFLSFLRRYTLTKFPIKPESGLSL